MRPTLEPGDRLLVDTGAYRSGPPVVDDLVVLVDPEAPGRWLVKRVRAIGPDGVHVAGDAPAESRDSRRFGPVPVSALIGRVYRRYGPIARRGDL
jgi:nickel-type superoxide dismutase maturation protease